MCPSACRNSEINKPQQSPSWEASSHSDSEETNKEEMGTLEQFYISHGITGLYLGHVLPAWSPEMCQNFGSETSEANGCRATIRYEG